MVKPEQALKIVSEFKEKYSIPESEFSKYSPDELKDIYITLSAFNSILVDYFDNSLPDYHEFSTQEMNLQEDASDIFTKALHIVSYFHDIRNEQLGDKVREEARKRKKKILDDLSPKKRTQS